MVHGEGSVVAASPLDVQEAQEDVQRVEVHRRRDREGVVEGVWDPHRPVHVVEDQDREEPDADPVHPHERSLDRSEHEQADLSELESEQTEQRHAEVASP